MNNFKKHPNNSGFTLLEILIVLTITAIMITFIGLTLGMLNGANINKAAKNCQHALVQGSVQTMAKGPSTNKVYVWDNNGKTCIKVGDAGESEVLCNSKVKSYFVKFNTSTMTLAAAKAVSDVSVSESASLCFVFNNIGAINKTDSSIYLLGEYNGIMFKKGTRQTVVYICPETGKTGVKTL